MKIDHIKDHVRPEDFYDFYGFKSCLHGTTMHFAGGLSLTKGQAGYLRRILQGNPEHT